MSAPLAYVLGFATPFMGGLVLILLGHAAGRSTTTWCPIDQEGERSSDLPDGRHRTRAGVWLWWRWHKYVTHRREPEHAAEYREYVAAWKARS